MAKTSNYCCCCCFCNIKSDKILIRLTSFCMIQGLIWSLGSAFLLAVQTCALKFKTFEDLDIPQSCSNEIEFIEKLIFAAYLSDGCYPRPKDDWPLTNATSERTYNLLLIHGFLSALWIPVSVLLIVAIRSRYRGVFTALFLYCPWLLVTFAVILFDLLSALFYIYDEKFTGSLQEFLVYIGYKLYTKDFTIPANFTWDPFTRYVPLFFILYFTKGCLFTIFNIVFLYQIFSLTKYVARERSQPLISHCTYDDSYVPKYKKVQENIPMQSYSSASYLQWMEIYQPSPDHHYEIIITPCKEYGSNNLLSKEIHSENQTSSRESQFPDYMSLVNYNNDYQYAYENIWRDVKNENVANVTHIYDYLGRPVAESKIAVKNNFCKDVNIRKGSMLTSMDLIHIEKIVNSDSSKKANGSSFHRSKTSSILQESEEPQHGHLELRQTVSSSDMGEEDQLNPLHHSNIYECIPCDVSDAILKNKSDESLNNNNEQTPNQNILSNIEKEKNTSNQPISTNLQSYQDSLKRKRHLKKFSMPVTPKYAPKQS